MGCWSEYARAVRFAWDPDKARKNLARHRVSFEEAASAILDPFALEVPDLQDATRMIVIGMSGRHRVLFVVTLIVEDDVVRIISARRASRLQRKRYEETS